MAKYGFTMSMAVVAAACGPVDAETGTSQEAVFTGGEPWPGDPPKTDGAGGEPCRVVEDVCALRKALAEKHQGWVCVPSDREIDLTGFRRTRIYPGTRLWGGRDGVTLGARLFTTDLGDRQCDCVPDSNGELKVECGPAVPPLTYYAMLEILGDTSSRTNGETRIQGFRLHGPSITPDKVNGIIGVSVRSELARDVVISNNELSGWTKSAVEVSGVVPETAVYPTEVCPDSDRDCIPHMHPDEAGEILITGNYIHHNVRDSLGYGVKVQTGAYAYIHGNVFDYNRHAVSHDGAPFSGYIARYNYVLEGGHCQDADVGCYYNQHFDVHGSGDDGYGGVGGEYFEITQNTIRGDQTYGLNVTRPALYLRAEPTEGVVFRDNVLVHDDLDAAIKLYGIPWLRYENLVAGPNRYDLDSTGALAVGDFDGDRRDDVFLATGTAWYYSSAGQTEWRFLRATTLGIARLGFGDFDGDGVCDVFWRGAEDGRWYIVPAGRGESQPINQSDVAFDLYRFGDFNGDGVSDVFRATGSSWLVSWGGRSTWDSINVSIYGVEDLRFGDFDGDGITDVFSIGNGDWRWSRSGRSSWAPLRAALSTDLGSLVFGDFNGDGRTDIVQRNGDAWRYSEGGRTAWIALRGAGGQPEYASPTACLVGDFNRDGRDDCLRYQMVEAVPGFDIFVPGRYFFWWTRGSDPFLRRSRHPMR